MSEPSTVRGLILYGVPGYGSWGWIPWRVRTLPWLRGCTVPACVLAGVMLMRALHLFVEPMVVRARRDIDSGCVRSVYIRRVLRPCFPLRRFFVLCGPHYFVFSHIVRLFWRLLTEPKVVFARCKCIARDSCPVCTCSALRPCCHVRGLVVLNLGMVCLRFLLVKPRYVQSLADGFADIRDGSLGVYV